MMSKVHEPYPNLEMFWTEGGPGFASTDYPTDGCDWGVTFTGVFRGTGADA